MGRLILYTFIMLMFLAGVAVALFGLTVFVGAPYVPSRKRELVQCFKELYPLGEKDCLVDLGAGDGTVLAAACAQGAQAVGVELNPLLVLFARWRLRKYARAEVVFGNLFRAEFPEKTTVVYLFGDSRDMGRIEAKVKAEARRLGRDLWLISNGFELMGRRPEKKFRAFFLYKIRG